MLTLPNAALPVLAVGLAATALRRLRPALDARALALLFTLAVSLGAIARLWHGPAHLLDSSGSWTTAGIGALASVLVNNLPAAVVLSAQPAPHPYALLLGLDLGPNLAITGSLSALLWLQAARTVGAHASITTYTRLGLVLVPLTLAATLATLPAAPGRAATNRWEGLQRSSWTYDASMSSAQTFADVLAANETYADGFRLPGLPAHAAKGLAVLTCIDSRIEPLAMLGLEPGDAKILRNAGARVTDDVLRTLVLASYLLGVDRAMVIAHTDCRMAAGSEDEVHAAVSEAGGPDTRSLAFLVTSDQKATVRADVQRIRSWPYLTHLHVGGFLYDTDTGRLSHLC